MMALKPSDTRKVLSIALSAVYKHKEFKPIMESLDVNKYSHIFFNDLHFQIIEQIKKFNDKEVEPHGLQWENDGCVPNEIIKKLGQLGYLGIRYPKKMEV